MTMMKTRAPLTNPAIRTQTSSAHLSHWRGQAVQATPPHIQAGGAVGAGNIGGHPGHAHSPDVGGA